MKGIISIVFLLFIVHLSIAQIEQEPKRSYQTTRVTDVAPVIDGILADEAWKLVEWSGDFIGHRPTYKATPSQQTQFKILYDAKFIYVAVRAFDTEPDKIVKRMSRRDGFEGDWVELNIDSYNDKRTAFSFTATVSGVKGDEYISNNGDDWDSTWDPIWYLKTSVDDLGWIAEYKIPLSQLRFADKPEHTWGIQVQRRLFRIEERSTWQAVSPQAPGWVHMFGELKGIVGIKPQKQLEVQPYVVAQVDKFTPVEDDPYREDGRTFSGNIGVDAKIGVTSDITLDLTINPDFGQVEADPSVVNLSAYEQFFRERRPFFLEGNNIFSFPISGGPNNLFYSRRIGAPAHGYVEDEDIDYIDRIPNTRILSAAKLTGKNAKGFSWGVLSSLTGEVNVKVTDSLGNERKEKIEPYTLYNTARFQQDLNEGQTVVGAIFTHMKRYGNDENSLEYLHDKAISGGVDITHNMWNRKYALKFQFSGSKVSGNESAILDTQESYTRVFQRPDNDYRHVDTTRTSLAGTSSRIQFGKRSGNWRWDLGINHRSPGFEPNDIGFLSNTDNINVWGWSQYRIQEVRKIFRQQYYNIHLEQNFDFGGTNTFIGMGGNVNLEFKNFWNIDFNIWNDIRQISNADLRGGPSLRRPGGTSLRFGLGTNRRKKLALYVGPSFYFGQDNASESQQLSVSLTARPSDAWEISLNPSVRYMRDDLQYISTLDIDGDPLYLMGQINRRTYEMSLRMNYNITPNLTLELWAQPFLAVGEYEGFKEITTSTHEEYDQRFNALGNSVRVPTSTEISEFVSNNEDFDTVDDFPEMAYGVFKTDGTTMDTYFESPDFNVVNFRSNFVARWEYIPGSTVFFVWSSNGSFYDQEENNEFKDLTSQLWDLESNNTFLVKYTYRFAR